MTKINIEPEIHSPDIDGAGRESSPVIPSRLQQFKFKLTKIMINS